MADEKELSSPPTGTVTFLFTDIEGSTRLWEQYPEPMKSAHFRHVELILNCVERHGGTFVRLRGEGDSTFSVFPDAPEALAAASAFQRALAAEPWPAETPIRVRAALHTGTAHLSEGDYNSTDVNRCARLRSIAHGGQTILSRIVFSLTHGRLPPDATLSDLGLHRLKDLQEPEHVYQLCHPDLRRDFPPLNSLNTLPNNLPRQTTSFIGRVREMQEIKQRLTVTPLLTLTGAGGCGKTRLALQVAADVLETYPNGVWLVEFAALKDPTLVPQTIAAALGIREEPGRLLFQTLCEYLKSQSLLLVLDNCEHLIAACAEIADLLLKSCPKLCILATSREGLNIPGENTYRVPSLLPPDPKQLPSAETDLTNFVFGYDAVRLFVERASLHQPAFALTRQNATSVAQVCHRLDGIPLALELAAARVRTLSMQQIEARLEDRFMLLTTGSRTASPRQQTLRALIDWSYDLLNEPEQLLLRRLSVFMGGWTLDAAEAVCTSKDEGGRRKEEENGIHPSSFILPPLDILDLLTSLVDKSLVIVEEQEGEMRYRLLETVRRYAQEKLIDADEETWLRNRHRDWFVAFAEHAPLALEGPHQAAWLKRLELEHDNLRSALDWCAADPNGAEAGMLLAGALGRFWYLHGYLREGRARLETVLNRPDAAHPGRARSRALTNAGILAWAQEDLKAAQMLLDESLAVRKTLGETASIPPILLNLGLVAREQGSYPQAEAYLQECLALSEQYGNNDSKPYALLNLGVVALDQGHTGQARICFEQALPLARQRGDEVIISVVLVNLGDVERQEGHFELARLRYLEGLDIAHKLGDKNTIAGTLENLAGLELEMDRFQRAVQLWGVTDSLRETLQFPMSSTARSEYDRNIAVARSALGDKAFNSAWIKGRKMTLEQAVKYAQRT